jgi:ketosteroid isomerase-like protein
MAKVKLLICFLCFFCTINLNAQNKDSIAVVQAAENFVKAFNHFDWTTFRSSFTDDATIFFPFWQQGKRRAGKQEIESTWLDIFPEFLNNPDNDTLQIYPEDVHIQLYGETAIITFHLGDGIEQLSRRTLVLIKQNNDWKIFHLHASTMTPILKKQK